MANSVKEIAMQELGPLVEKMGFVLVDAEYVKRPNGMNLNLYIDREEGVDLDGLETVHRAVDAKLDELDPTNGAPYTLNCSSLGLDRPITTEYQYKKALQSEVEVKLYEPLKPQNKKVIEGVLNAYTDETVTIIFDGQELTLNKKQIAQIVPVIKF